MHGSMNIKFIKDTLTACNLARLILTQRELKNKAKRKKIHME
jgi:hypothetical protein